MPGIKLSICIATFKRGAFIGETLESILPQCGDTVEVVVVDGASPDNTEEIVKGYERRFPCLRYIRQSTNKGVDEDFSTAVSLARGEYCWLMSDDDLLKQGAVAKILNKLDGAINLVIVNAEVRSANLSQVLTPKQLQFESDRTYSAAENETLFSDTAQFLSFIGCVVIKKQLWDQREKEKYFGTVFIHVGVIFQAPIPGQTLVVADPLISIRYGNAQWSARGFEIWMFKWPKLIWSFPGFRKEAKRKVCPSEPWRRLLPLLSLRALGVFSLKEYSHWIAPQTLNILSRSIIVAICLVPAWMLNFIADIYFRYVRYSPVKLVDLRTSQVYWKKMFGGVPAI